MVQITSLVGVLALVSTMVHGLPRPRPDSAVGVEVGVSAPNGIPLTNSVELSSQLSREAATRSAEPARVTQYGGNYGASSSEMKSSEWKEEPKVEEPMHTTVAQEAPKHTTPAYEAPKYTSPAHEPAKTTVAAQPQYTSPSYGSGSSNWKGSSEYEDCVQQCVAKYSSPLGEYKPTATTKVEGEAGTGATHTVIVAPSQGVLRYIPFAVNASVGDTVKFMWGANNHTVTKSSSLLPCNASAESAFDTKIQVKDFTFVQKVTTTEPTFFHCTVGVHCQRGMFGIINPASGLGAADSVSSSMQTLAANSSTLAGYMSYTQKNIQNNEAASKWGGSIKLDAIPEWAHSVVAENVLYTRNFLAANPDVLKEDGSVSLDTTAPLAIPQDIGAALNSAGSGTAATSASTIAAPAPSATETPASNAGSLNSGAASLSSSKVLVVALAGVATFFLL